jgi:hypothetical protein
MTDLNGVVRLLKEEQDRLTRQLQGIGAALAAFGKTYVQVSPRKLSAAGRARIAAAQRARWAKVKASSKGKVVATPKKRTLSAAARRKIAAAQRVRWEKVKAAKKST